MAAITENELRVWVEGNCKADIEGIGIDAFKLAWERCLEKRKGELIEATRNEKGNKKLDSNSNHALADWLITNKSHVVTKGVDTVRPLLDGRGYHWEPPGNKFYEHILAILKALDVTAVNRDRYLQPGMRFDDGRKHRRETYIRRSEILDTLIARLRELKSTPAATTQSRSFYKTACLSSSLIGTGGFGKTQIAAGLGNELEINVLFPDGLAWLQLSETPDVNQLTRDLAAHLKAKLGSKKTLAEVGVHALAEVIADRHLLLVIDDCWREEDVKEITDALAQCKNSVILLTTRSASIAQYADRAIDVETMSQDDAITLLTQNLPSDQPLSQDDAIQLVNRAGCWPLMVDLIRGVLISDLQQSKGDVQKAVRMVDGRFKAKGVRGFSVNGFHQKSERFRCVDAVVRISLDALAKDNEASIYGENTAVDYYRSLAIFPDDSDIPLAVLHRYWNFNTLDQAKILAGCFERFRLILPRKNNDGIVLHDVLRDYLRNLIGEEQLRVKHATLVNCFEPHVEEFLACLDQEDIPENIRDLVPPYFWQHHAYHLCEAWKAVQLTAHLNDINYVLGKAYVLNSPFILAADLAFLKKYGLKSLLDKEITNMQKQHWCFNMGFNYGDYVTHIVPRVFEYQPTDLRYQRPFVPYEAFLPMLVTPDEEVNVYRHESGVLYCEELSDGRIVSATFDGALWVWDLKTWQSRKLEGHTGTVIHCTELSDGRLVSASEDCTLRVWDLVKKDNDRVLKGHTGTVIHCTELSDGRLVSASEDCTLRVWDLETETDTELGRHDGWVNHCVVLEKDRLISASSDWTLRVWNLKSREYVPLTGHKGAVTRCSVLPNGRVLSASQDGTLRVWDLDMKKSMVLRVPRSEWIENSRVNIRKIHWTNTLGKCWLAWLYSYQTEPIMVLPNGHVAAAVGDGRLRVWDLVSQKYHTLQSCHGRIMHLSILPDGRLVSASGDYTLSVWDLNSGESIVLQGHTNAVTHCCVLSDGRIVSGSIDCTLRVWDLALRGNVVRNEHINSVSQVKVFPDGDAAISVSNDKTLWLWDLKSGAHVALHTSASKEDIWRLPDGREVTINEYGSLCIHDPILCTNIYLKDRGLPKGFVGHENSFGLRGKILESEPQNYEGLVVQERFLPDGGIIQFDNYGRLEWLDFVNGRVESRMLHISVSCVCVIDRDYIVIGTIDGKVIPLKLYRCGLTK